VKHKKPFRKYSCCSNYYVQGFCFCKEKLLRQAKEKISGRANLLCMAA